MSIFKKDKESHHETVYLTKIQLGILQILSDGAAYPETSLFNHLKALNKSFDIGYPEQTPLLKSLEELGLIRYWNPHQKGATNATYNKTHAAITQMGLLFVDPICPLPLDRSE